MPSKKARSTVKSAKTEKAKKQPIGAPVKDEVAMLASAEPKKDEPKSITLGELMLGVLIIAIGFFIGYKKYISTKNQAEDTAKFYKSEAMAANLELFFKDKAYYPTEKQLKDETWLADNAPKLIILSDDGFNHEIGSDDYKYTVLPENCDNGTTKCDGYKITINPSSSQEIVEQTGGSAAKSSDASDDSSYGTESTGTSATEEDEH